MILRYIHYFLAVAEHGSFTRAADVLHVSQPALSQQIKLLEQALAVQLFDRSGRHIHLTEEGKVYQRYAQQALRELDAGKRAIHDVQDLSRGSLRLGLIPTYTPWLIGPLLKAFWQRYPGIQLTVNEATQDHIEQQLLANELDVGLGYAGEQAAELTAVPFMQESLSLVVNKAHALASRGEISLADIPGQPLVLLDTGFSTRTQIDQQCQKQGVTPDIVAETNTIGVMLEFILHAPLAALMPETLARSHDDLVALKVVPPLAPRTAVLLMRKDSQHAATHAVIELMTEIMQIR